MNEEFYESGGILSDADIQKEMKNGNIFISPFLQSQLQPSGYNLTPTRFFYSTKKRRFLPVIENEEETYVIIDKNDTVLVRTRESVAISQILTGAFYSKVKVVSEGFGHVSTTLDPNWEGQLLISLNNPTNRKLKFSIEKEVYGKKICNSFVTLEFMYLNQPALNSSDNPPGRLDILDSTIEHNISSFKKKKIEILENLVKQLHEQETKTIEHLIMMHLNDDERQEWKEISIIGDDDSYNVQRNSFLRKKKEKYLRLIQKEFLKNAEISIDIINRYIKEKQDSLSLRQRIIIFVSEHLYTLSWFLFLVFLSALSITGYNLTKPEKIELNEIVSNIIIYLVMPLIVGSIVNFIAKFDKNKR